MGLSRVLKPNKKLLFIAIWALLFWGLVCYAIFVFHLGLRRGIFSKLQDSEETKWIRVREASDGSSTSRSPTSMASKQGPSDEKSDIEHLENELPNLPYRFLHEAKAKALMFKNKTCAKLPTVYDIHFNNIYWQETTTSNGTFYLYGAYLDVRETNKLGPSVRILGMIDRLEPQVKTNCLIWFKDSQEPILSKVIEYKYIWIRNWGNYKPGIFQPYLLACQLPKSHWKKAPAVISVVENICDPVTNSLRVIHNEPVTGSGSKKGFAVCVKGLDFPNEDLSFRLVEWFELLALLGVNKIFMYELEVHPNVSKVLAHYVSSGLVDLTPISLPGHQPNIPVLQHLYLKSKVNNKRQNELVPYNDCFYRNMYQYEFVALLDIDEVIMPLKHDNWSDLMDELKKLSLKDKGVMRASYNFRNVYFMDNMHNLNEDAADFRNVPEFMHMLRHVHRSANHTKPAHYVKCFHNTDRVLILHNHFPLGCLGGACTTFAVDPELAHLQHYRSDCVKSLKKTCDELKNSTIQDSNIWRFKKSLVSRSVAALSQMGLLAPREVL